MSIKSLAYIPFSLFVVIVILILTIADHLTLPHFWDEAWVYVPAIKTMAESGLSMMPGAISLDLSRGHPLLFQFMGAAWVTVFGPSNISMHLFALMISCGVLLVAYYLVSSLLNWKAAFVACMLLSLQPMFLAQSVMLYPEMLMTLGVLMALMGYVRPNTTWLFVLGLSIALYAKESALVFLIAFMLTDVLKLVAFKASAREFLKYLIPLGVLASHPLLLYAEYGWFLYPEHTGYITWEITDVKYRLRLVFWELFEHQNRQWIFYGTLVIAVLRLRLKHFSWNLLLIACGFSAYKVLVWKWVVTDWLFISIMILAVLLPIVFWLFLSRQKPTLNGVNKLFVFTYAATVGFLVFCAINFFTPRYLLVALVLLILAVSIIIWSEPRLGQWVKIAFSGLFIVLSVHALVTVRTVSEVNLGLYDDMILQQSLVDWMETNVHPRATVSTNFITKQYLTDPKAGYIEGDSDPFIHILDICADRQQADYYIYTSTTAWCDQPPKDSLLAQGYKVVFDSSINASSTEVLYKQVTVID